MKDLAKFSLFQRSAELEIRETLLLKDPFFIAVADEEAIIGLQERIKNKITSLQSTKDFTQALIQSLDSSKVDSVSVSIVTKLDNLIQDYESFVKLIDTYLAMPDEEE